MPEAPLDGPNAQYMRAMGLDPETLGQFIPQNAKDPNRCPSINAQGQQCARYQHEPGTVHARGYDRWVEEGEEPSRAVTDGPTISTPEGFSTDIPKISGTRVDTALRDELVRLVAHSLMQLGITGDEFKDGQTLAAEIAVDTVIERLAGDHA